ncbi:MAG: hypothetical protein M0T70_06005 [Geobacteraceae bacterium]|nr:hypothetical protein [Geobacteraceae bacterium]
MMLFFMGVPPDVDFRGLVAAAGRLVNAAAFMPGAFLFLSIQRNVIHESEINSPRQEINDDQEET